jgi:hypothetical protein
VVVDGAVAAVEVSRRVPRSFERGCAAVKDLLHASVDPHAGVMWDVTDRTCAPGGFWLESHQRLVAAARSIDWVVRMGMLVSAGWRSLLEFLLARSCEGDSRGAPSLVHVGME